MVKRRKLIALLFLVIAVILGAVFYSKLDFPQDPGSYFKKEYYGQFGPLAIAVELFIAGLHLFTKHEKANFTLALFGFTAILDPLFNFAGVFSSQMPMFATFIFGACAVVSLWLSFSNAFQLGRISFWAAIGSFLLSNVIELFFNLGL